MYTISVAPKMLIPGVVFNILIPVRAIKTPVPASYILVLIILVLIILVRRNYSYSIKGFIIN